MAGFSGPTARLKVFESLKPGPEPGLLSDSARFFFSIKGVNYGLEMVRNDVCVASAYAARARDVSG